MSTNAILSLQIKVVWVELQFFILDKMSPFYGDLGGHTVFQSCWHYIFGSKVKAHFSQWGVLLWNSWITHSKNHPESEVIQRWYHLYKITAHKLSGGLADIQDGLCSAPRTTGRNHPLSLISELGFLGLNTELEGSWKMSASESGWKDSDPPHSSPNCSKQAVWSF